MIPYKLIIAGSRGWTDYQAIINAVRAFYKHFKINAKNNPPVIISGTARGADQLGEKLAKQFNLELIRMPAQWDTYGKSAGYKRNEEMAKIAHGCLVFWDGQSKRSQHMHNLAKQYHLQTMLIQ